MNPLFQHYPRLESNLPHLALGNYPSAVQRLSGLERACSAQALYLKRDDAADDAYGGNKLRKLEFLLADAKARGARRVLTFGAVGSNHALATAVHATALGLGATSMLVPQVPSRKACRNLLASHAVGAELLHYPDERALGAALPYHLERHRQRDGVAPAIVPGGGSSALGAVGFVEAGLELAAQVAAGELPAPERIYMALGTTGTAAGLALGLQVAGLSSRLVAVRVVQERFGNRGRLDHLIEETARLLHQRSDGTFPLVRAEQCAVELRHDFYGGEYARYTQPGIEAVRRLRLSDDVTLEGTYTGKAMAAMLADLQDPALAQTPMLFWNTFSSRPLRGQDTDYRNLPGGFHRYFEMDMQPLDTAMEDAAHGR